MAIMERTHRRLLGLLIVQVAVAAALAWAPWHPAASAASKTLLTFDKSAVDRLLIEGPDKARAELVRQAGLWDVAQADGFQADAPRVTRLLDQLSSVASGAPVATSAGAAERFKVADTDFERRISVETAGKPVAILLLGNSQGVRRSYARRSGETAVYAVDLATYDIPAKADDWLDKTALRIPRDDIVGLTLAGLTLKHAAPTADAGEPASAAKASTSAKAAPAWQADGLAAGESLDVKAVDRLAQSLAELSFSKVRSGDDAARKSLGDVELRIGVTRKGGQHIDYTVYKLPSGDERALVLSDRPETFTLTAQQAKVLAGAAARKVLTPETAKTAAK